VLKIPFANWIANAAACLNGSYGQVTRQAGLADCSRQTVYDHASKVHAAVVAEHQGGPTHAELLRQHQHLSRDNAQLWEWLAQTIEFPKAKQEQFAVTAAAMGLSLNQVLVLLALLLGRQTGPGRSTVHRRIKAAGLAAGRILKALDARCRALVLVGCLDEIFFHGRPVLVGVEPASMAWFLGQVAPDRTGATWAKALHDWTALEFVAAAAGTGLQAGIAAVQRGRRGPGQVPLENGLDVFHTTQEARRVLRQGWSHVERCWELAEAASRRAEQARRHGRDSRGAAGAERWAWGKAEAAFGQYERAEAGWKLAHAALAVFRPDGRLNNRVWAGEQIALALAELSGREWSKVRGLLQAEETLTFLGRLDRQLREAVPGDPLRDELVRLWWLRRRRPRANLHGDVVGTGHVAHLVQQVVCHGVEANWRESYGAVSRVLRRTVRASSAVECMNSVLRMHQSRHRTVSQGLLDLKRLYWNCREFREGRRRRHCPYQLLSLRLPSYRFWDLLWMPSLEAEAI
jgi:hypothetical protein